MAGDARPSATFMTLSAAAASPEQSPLASWPPISTIQATSEATCSLTSAITPVTARTGAMHAVDQRPQAVGHLLERASSWGPSR